MITSAPIFAIATIANVAHRSAAFVAFAGCLLAAPHHAFGQSQETGRVTWSGGLTVVHQAADDSSVDPEFSASADLFATIPRPRGEWLIHVEGSTSPDADGISALYPTANADAGSVLNRDGDGGVQISELHYTFFMENSRSLMIGLIDPSAWLDRSRIANDENLHFLNGSFVNNATVDFPDYTLGGVFRLSGSASRPEITVIVASSDGIADVPDRSYQDLLNLTAGGRGAFVAAGVRWLRKQYSVRVGAWLRSDDHVVAGNPDATEMNYGAYGVLGWQGDADAWNIRVGFANEDVSVAAQFAAVAYERRTRLGLLGAGIARTLVANSFRRAELHNTLDAEIFFRVPFGAGHITPSLQYVRNPGFQIAGPATPSSAAVLGARLHWFF